MNLCNRTLLLVLLLFSLSTNASGSGVGTVTNPYLTESTALSTFQSGTGFTGCPTSGTTYNSLTTPSYHPLSSEDLSCPFTGIKEVLYGAPNSTGPGSGGGWLTYVANNGVTCGNTMTGSSRDPISGVVKRCYYRDYTPPPSIPSLNSDGYFYSRVQVCNVDSSGVLLDNRDYGLCTKYPNKTYKPTGAIQKYSDQLRLTAFGYLMDQVDTRVGGVLRAPVKYVGARTFDINGKDNTIAGGNPNREWDENTGVFFPNPNGNTTVPCLDSHCRPSPYYLSGVVNYVNQFGRTGAIPGRYKIYDPLSELHYEILRYLQGLSPSTTAISNITADMYDGYPVFTTWTDPYGDGRTNTSDYSCLKSNVVMIGDKNTQERGFRMPTANDSNNIPDISYWRGIVQSFEKGNSTTYIDGKGFSRSTSNPSSTNNSVPSGDPSQILGTAYWAHTQDIRGAKWTNSLSLQRPGLRVKTFMFDVNEFGQSNDANTRRTTNQLFMAAKYGGFEADSSNAEKNPYNTWGNPFKKDDGTNDYNVWQSLTNPGEASTYYLQSNARGVLNAFDSIFSRAATAGRSIAGAAIQSKNLTTSTNIYQGTFDTSDWSGDLLAIPINDVNNVVSISSAMTWTAATQLALSARNIVVGISQPIAGPLAVPFLWGNIEDGLKGNLNKASPTATPDGLGSDRLDYLRGNRSKEGTTFRVRNKLLGDIINSGIAYSDAGTPAVFVGANDGMLHAFDAATGKELFAYIPSWMGPKLSALTVKTYDNNHQSYVDGTPTVTKIKDGASIKSILVGGTGGGGQGIFALDVTDPLKFTSSNVMWEFTHTDDPDMGNVVGRIQILKLRTSDNESKWFAVTGSGVNNYTTAVSSNYSSGSPVLFLIDINKTADAKWTLGTNYFKVSFPVNSTLSATMATGLINFTAISSNNGEVAHIYAGDLHGNMWKLDFTGVFSKDWTLDKLSSFHKSKDEAITLDPYPLFIAKDESGNVQPITMAPNIVFGANNPAAGWILFGTGKFLELNDKTSTSQQSFYMVYDDATSLGDTITYPTTRVSAISGRGRLQVGTVSTGIVSIPEFIFGRAVSDTDSTQRSGWYFNFYTSGERQISNATILSDTIVFGSLIPNEGTVGSCGTLTGGGNQYSVKIVTGNGTSSSSKVGILGEPITIDLSDTTKYTPSDSTGKRMKTILHQFIQQGSQGLALGGTNTTTSIVGRMNWRQIFNYQDLKYTP